MNNNIQVKVLGTVSPYCKDNHNCPGFLVEHKKTKILLDCGNGITRLLKFPNDLNNLSIFISHFHKDHYGDLGSIQYASYVYHNLGLLDKKVNIYMPYNNDASLYDGEAVASNKESYTNIYYYDEKTNVVCDNFNLSFFLNNHSLAYPTFSTNLQVGDRKIVYTADTEFVYNGEKTLAAFAKDADLLICESSLAAIHNNKSNTHLQAHQAGELAKLANAKQLLLTHFWPETSKKIYLEEAKQVFSKTQVAEEGQVLTLKMKKML